MTALQQTPRTISFDSRKRLQLANEAGPVPTTSAKPTSRITESAINARTFSVHQSNVLANYDSLKPASGCMNAPSECPCGICDRRQTHRYTDNIGIALREQIICACSKGSCTTEIRNTRQTIPLFATSNHVRICSSHSSARHGPSLLQQPRKGRVHSPDVGRSRCVV